MSGYVPRKLRGQGASNNKSSSKRPSKTESSSESGVATATKPRARPQSDGASKKKRPSPRPGANGSEQRRPSAKKKSTKRQKRGFKWLNWRAIRLPRIRDWRMLGQRLAGAALGTIALAVIMWFVAGQPSLLAPSTSEAQSAAKTAAGAMFSYDYRTFDESKKNGAAHIVGDYHKEYADMMDKLENQVKKEKARVSAQISDAGVMSSDVECAPKNSKDGKETTGETYSGGVRVLVFLNQNTKNTNIKGPGVSSSRVMMCMVSTSDGWRAADATLI